MCPPIDSWDDCSMPNFHDDTHKDLSKKGLLSEDVEEETSVNVLKKMEDSVRSVDLSHSTSQKACSLSSMLRRLATIKQHVRTLILDGNSLGVFFGAKDLTVIFSSSLKNITKLSLANNKFNSPEGFTSLCEVLSSLHNTEVTELDLSDNNFSLEQCLEILKILPRRITKLRLHGTNLITTANCGFFGSCISSIIPNGILLRDARAIVAMVEAWPADLSLELDLLSEDESKNIAPECLQAAIANVPSGSKILFGATAEQQGRSPALQKK